MMRGLYLLALVVAGLPLAAAADGFCNDLTALMQATTGDGPATFTVPDGAADCTRNRELGGLVAVQCGWPFDYRAPEATAAFARIAADVAACGETIVATDAKVSHPDSYDLRQFSFGAGTVSVSLKDKGGLNETYVFIRAGRQP